MKGTVPHPLQSASGARRFDLASSVRSTVPVVALITPSDPFVQPLHLLSYSLTWTLVLPPLFPCRTSTGLPMPTDHLMRLPAHHISPPRAHLIGLSLVPLSNLLPSLPRIPPSPPRSSYPGVGVPFRAGMHSPSEDTRFGPEYPSARVLSLSLSLYEKYCRECCPFILHPYTERFSVSWASGLLCDSGM